MTAKTDDLEAVRVLVETLQPFTSDDRERIIRWAREKLGMVAVVGTQGRAVDHIGFEVKNLEEFCKKLEAQGIKLDRPYTKVAALGIAIAFIKDPWGTYIELTEGLNKVS